MTNKQYRRALEELGCRSLQLPSIWASRAARHRTGRLGSPPFTPAPSACCAFCSTAKSRSMTSGKSDSPRIGKRQANSGAGR